MRLRISHTEFHATLLLMGTLTAADAEGGANSIIESILETGRSNWLIDLTRITAIDDDGVTLLRAICGRAMAAGRRLGLLVEPGPIEDALVEAHLAPLAPVFHDTETYLSDMVPEARWASVHPCRAEEHPMAMAARALSHG